MGRVELPSGKDIHKALHSYFVSVNQFRLEANKEPKMMIC